MKRFVIRCAAFGAGLMWTGIALATQPQLAPPEAPQATDTSRGTMAAYFEDEKKKEEAPAAPAAEATSPASNCGCATEPSCGAENSCGNSCGCGDSCGCDCVLCIDNVWPFCCCCDYGDPCTLKKHLTPCCDLNYGGWIAAGFYTNNDPLSTADNDLKSFWDNPNGLNLDQGWFYIEDLAKSDGCGWDCGYRFDLLYGVDAQKMQAFGNSGFPNPQGYDNSWDNGKYGWALPQAYLQFVKGDLDIKVGHFFTPLGYEVLPATGNFFYSHNFTVFNSEPFTHTGALATYKANDCVTYYGGWTLGWDTGFDQFRNGSNFLGGVGLKLNENAKYTYLCTAGDLGWRGDGYSHSNVLDLTLSKKWEYVFQSDLLTANANTAATNDGLSYGIVNYLFYTINDCWKWGTRAEWWKSNQATANVISYYEVTTGFNYKASANLIIRPEVKFNWVPAEDTFENTAGNGQFNKTLFGMDAIYTF